MADQDQHLRTLNDIRSIMQRSSRFISLSGLSGIAAGFWALAGAYFAHSLIAEHYHNYNDESYTGNAFQQLKGNLLLLAGGVLFLSLISAFFFTWRKASKNKLPIWDHTSRNLLINLALPLVAGGLFILAMLQLNEWRLAAPVSLIFYGLALVNGGKYTLTEIRYLGILEIILGLVATQFPGYGLWFWGVGFGVLHIIYGFIMWWKYERNPVQE